MVPSPANDENPADDDALPCPILRKLGLVTVPLTELFHNRSISIALII